MSIIANFVLGAAAAAIGHYMSGVPRSLALGFIVGVAITAGRLLK